MANKKTPSEEAQIDEAYRSITGREPQVRRGGTSCLGMVILALFVLAAVLILSRLL